MFMGEYKHSIDTKGRVIMPAKFRTDLGESFIITKGLDNCLFVYSQNEWSDLEKKLVKLSFTNPKSRAFSRIFFAGATEVNLDKQGRVLIAPSLRDHAKLEKETIIIGVSERIEIWNKENWEKYNNNLIDDYENLAEDLFESLNLDL